MKEKEYRGVPNPVGIEAMLWYAFKTFLINLILNGYG